MSAGFKKLIFIVGMFIFVLLIPLSVAAKKIYFNPTCDGGECSISLNAGSRLSREFCSTASIIIWNKWDRRYYMVQCDCECTMQANHIWLVDRNERRVFGFSSGRIFSSDFIRQSSVDTEIPDRFSSVKFCEAPRADALDGAIFVMLHKRPSENDQPDCYEVIYVYSEKSSVVISGDSGIIETNRVDYWLSRVSRQQRLALLHLGEFINEK
jgi:hypothetical protein